jgi:hypothetical protein
MIHDEKSAGSQPGHHGRIIMKLLEGRSRVDCDLRQAPSSVFVRWFFALAPKSEYNYVGSVHERTPVVAGRLTGLPLPVLAKSFSKAFLSQ